MPQSFKSTISFGLVHVPITLHATVKNKDIGFNMLHKKSGQRIKFKKTCDDCPEHMTADDMVRAFQYERGKYVTFTNEELEQLKNQRSKSIEITQFVKLSEIDPMYYEKSYYVRPTGAEKAFLLILKTLESENKVGIAKTILGQKEQLVSLRVQKGNMILSTMHFHDEVKLNTKVQLDEKVTEQEMKLAKQIVANMTGKFDITKWQDEHRARVEEAIEAKIKGKKISIPKSDKAIKIINLMDALKASVSSSKQIKGKSKNENATSKKSRKLSA